MRHAALALLLLVPVARADDGSVAPETRWSHARGPASNSGMSRAEPPESFGKFAWTYKAKQAIAFPPVVWDGAAFVVDGKDLVALDAATGQLWARVPVKAGQPVAFAGSAFLVEEGKRLVEFRLTKRHLVREWAYDAGDGASCPRILDGEIYAATSGALLGLRVGMQTPAWKAEGAFTGEPAVRDGHVYALRRDGSNLVLAAFARTNGAEAASVIVSDKAEGRGGRVVVGRDVVGVLLPPEEARTWAVLSRKLDDDKLSLEVARREKLLTDPIAGNFTLIAVTEEPRQWCFLTANPQDQRRPLVTAKDRPDLFEAIVPCVWLGESSQCYGTWCGDPYGNTILWHLNERPEGAPLRKGLRFHAVPARTGLLLLVPADGKSVVALAPEEIR